MHHMKRAMMHVHIGCHLLHVTNRTIIRHRTEINPVDIRQIKKPAFHVFCFRSAATDIFDDVELNGLVPI